LLVGIADHFAVGGNRDGFNRLSPHFTGIEAGEAVHHAHNPPIGCRQRNTLRTVGEQGCEQGVVTPQLRVDLLQF
jgi:hypothetical protein